MPQGSFSSADAGLNAEELAGNGVKVDTLKTLLAKSTEEGDEKTPPKLISLDQVTVRGEDLTGKPSTCTLCVQRTFQV